MARNRKAKRFTCRGAGGVREGGPVAGRCGGAAAHVAAPAQGRIIAGGSQCTAELFRTRIKAVELEAERLQQEALFALAAALATENAATVEAAARANVAAYEHALARTFAPAAVDVLLAALSAGQPGAG